MLPFVYLLVLHIHGYPGEWKLAERPPVAYVGIEQCVRRAELLNYAEGDKAVWSCRQAEIKR